MDIQKELIEVSKKWDIAIAENNVPEMSKYMSEDWICVGSNGINDKATFIGWIDSGDLVHTVMDTDHIQAKIYGDMGIVTGRGTSAGTWKGNEFSLYEWSTSVFIKQNGQWICVHTMLVPTNKE